MIVLSPDGVEVQPGTKVPLRVLNDNHCTHAQLNPDWVRAQTKAKAGAAAPPAV